VGQRTQTLLPIGRFSRLCGLTIKALRHYDEIGLLRPAQVDASTGYRYYALDQLQQADLIASLRALDVPLEECSAILAENESQDVRARLVAHRARVADKARQLQRMLARLDDLIDAKAELLPAPIRLEKVELKDLEEQPTLTVRSRVARSDLDRTISKSINAVADHLQALGQRSAGPPFTICPDADEQDMLDVEIGWPTRERIRGSGEVESRALPAGRAAWAIHRGPYEALPGAYRALYEWIDAQGLEAVGDPREIYYTDPDETPDPADYVTGIVWPVH
jgi:DNA-binding transcriptional MerR regulator